MKKSLSIFLIALFNLSSWLFNSDSVESHPFEIVISGHEYPLNLELSKLWEDKGLGYIDILKSNSTWYLWYESFGAKSSDNRRPDYNSYFNYAYSNNGIDWIKPELEIVPYFSISKTNILWDNDGIPHNGIHGMTVYYDSRSYNNEDRFKLFYSKWNDEEASNWIYVMTSKNGLKWGNKRLLKKQYSDTQTVLFKDTNKYKLYFRYWTSGEHAVGYRQIRASISNYFDIGFDSNEETVTFSNTKTTNLHLYNNATQIIGKYEFLFPSIYNSTADEMTLKIANRDTVGVNTDFTFIHFNKNLHSSFPDYKVIYIAPNSIPNNNNSYQIYYSYKNERHNSINDTSLKYIGNIGRFVMIIIPK